MGTEPWGHWARDYSRLWGNLGTEFTEYSISDADVDQDVQTPRCGLGAVCLTGRGDSGSWLEAVCSLHGRTNLACIDLGRAWLDEVTSNRGTLWAWGLGARRDYDCKGQVKTNQLSSPFFFFFFPTRYPRLKSPRMVSPTTRPLSVSRFPQQRPASPGGETGVGVWYVITEEGGHRVKQRVEN